MTELNGANTLQYEVDCDDSIVSVDDSWLAFASSNQAPELSVKNVIGKSLIDFVSGNISRQFWLGILHIARNSTVPICIEYRCDSPKSKRFMRLEITHLGEGRLRFISTLLRDVDRPVTVHFQRARERNRHTLVRCSMCNRILYRGTWIEAEEMYPSAESITLQVIYGVCPDCNHPP